MAEKNVAGSIDGGVKMVVIAHYSGAPLVRVKLDEKLDDNLIIPFLTAVKAFSREVLGDDQDIQFKSGNMDLYCFTKTYNDVPLMIFALLDREMEKKDIRGEAEEALDAFVRLYSIDAIKNWDGNAEAFRSFEVALQGQIHEYYEKIGKGSDATDSKKRKGLLSRLVSFMKRG